MLEVSESEWQYACWGNQSQNSCVPIRGVRFIVAMCMLEGVSCQSRILEDNSALHHSYIICLALFKSALSTPFWCPSGSLLQCELLRSYAKQSVNCLFPCVCSTKIPKLAQIIEQIKKSNVAGQKEELNSYPLFAPCSETAFSCSQINGQGSLTYAAVWRQAGAFWTVL